MNEVEFILQELLFHYHLTKLKLTLSHINGNIVAGKHLDCQ
jgi:hypothetical protein